MEYSKEFLDGLKSKGLLESELGFIRLMGVGYYYMKDEKSLFFFNCYTEKSCSSIYQGTTPLYELCALLNKETGILLKSHTDSLACTCLFINGGPWDRKCVFMSSKVMVVLPMDAPYILNVPSVDEIKGVLFKDEDEWSLYLNYQPEGLQSYVYLESDCSMVLSKDSKSEFGLLLNVNTEVLGIKVLSNTYEVCKEVERLVKEAYREGANTEAI